MVAQPIAYAARNGPQLVAELRRKCAMATARNAARCWMFVATTKVKKVWIEGWFPYQI